MAACRFQVAHRS